MSAMGESELYQKLKSRVATSSKLKSLGYPQEDVEFNATGGDESTGFANLRRKAPFGVTLRDGFKSLYKCKRCEKPYRVNVSTGMPSSDSGTCVYHPGLFWIYEHGYKCCQNRNRASTGCCSNKYHVHEQDAELCNYTGFVKTQARGSAGCKVFAMDGEMCFTTIGLELTQLTLLNYKKEVIYETLCKPLNPILDYNTRYSGLREGDLDNVEKTLPDVQRELLQLISAETILVGHGLDHDMIEVKMFHENFVDTVDLYPHRKGLPRKNGLKALVKEHLHKDIQNGSSHDSQEDAAAAFDLALKYTPNTTPWRPRQRTFWRPRQSFDDDYDYSVWD